MCPEATHPAYMQAPPELSYTEREKHDLAQLAKYHYAKRGIKTYMGVRCAGWLEEEVPYGIVCPMSRDDSQFFAFWLQTRLVGPVEAEPLVWWLCKLGRLPFEYKKRRVAKERVTNSVLLEPTATRSWLRGYGTVCLSRAQAEKLIATIERSLSRHLSSGVPWTLDTSPAAVSAEQLKSGGKRPMGEYTWTDWPSDECESAVHMVYEKWSGTSTSMACKGKKEATGKWLCPVEYEFCGDRPTPFECFLDPVIVLGSSLHALRQREEAWPLQLRDEFKELCSVYEYAIRLLTVKTGAELATILKDRPSSLRSRAPQSPGTAQGDESCRVFMSHPRAEQPSAPFKSLEDEGAYAQAVRLAACTLDEADPEAGTKTLRPMSQGEARLGAVYDEILLVLDQAWNEGQLAMLDCVQGWGAIWPGLSEPCRQKLGGLFSQKAQLLFELQAELDIGVCQCPLDAPAFPEEWLHC